MPVRTLPVAALWCDVGFCSRTVVVIKLQRTSKYLIVFRLQLWVWLVACGGGACFGRKSLRHCASSHRLRGHCSGRWRLGWKDCCCGCLLLNLLAISTRLCSVTVSGVMLLTASDLRKKKKKKSGMERSGPTPPLSA